MAVAAMVVGASVAASLAWAREAGESEAALTEAV